MTPLEDPYAGIPTPTDNDREDDDGHYGTVVALRGELVDTPTAIDATDAVEILADGYRPTDVGNAERLIRAADGRLRYVHLWKTWLVYTGGRWVLDAGDAIVTQVAKKVARDLFRAAIETGDMAERDELWKHARRCEKSETIRNMVRLARAIPGVIVTHEELDARPWLLNVENGTVDLRTGVLQPHSPEDLLTKQAPVTFDPDATAPLWEACLATWQPDPDVLAFLHRAVGSGATGHPVEALIVNTGHGGNGKSKFYGAISKVLGPYVVVPHKSLLTEQRHEPHPTVIASLCGARMLIAAETKAGDRLNEASVKNLTGTDELRARRMQENEWSFWPSHTAFMHTNHDPKIQGTDDGIWRRVKIVPWSVKIAADAIDEHLLTKLAREASGILNWIVAGALLWAQDGLAEPQAVRAATDAYRASEDHLGRFLDDCCEVDARRQVTTGHLRARYEKWCTLNGEDEWAPQTFGRAMTARGFTAKQGGGKNPRLWLGLRLADPETAQNGRDPGLTETKENKAKGQVTGSSVTVGDGPASKSPIEGSYTDYTEEVSLTVTDEHTFPSDGPSPNGHGDPLEPF